MNLALVYGRLGKDPVLKQFEGGNGVCNFSVATSEKYTSKDGQAKESTQWHNVVAWGPLGQSASENLKKGDEVFIFGKTVTRSYEAEGGKKYVTELVANRIMMGLPAPGGARKTSRSEAPAPAKAPDYARDFSPDNIPF